MVFVHGLVHGTCTLPGDCNCNANWGGATCSVGMFSSLLFVHYCKHSVAVAVQISSPARQTVLVVMERHAVIQEQEGITVHVLQAIMALTVSMRPMSVY